MRSSEDAGLSLGAAAAIERFGHLRGNLIDLNAAGGVENSSLCVIGSFYHAATGRFDGWGDPQAEDAITRFAAHVGAPDRDALCAWNDARTAEEVVAALRAFAQRPRLATVP